MAMNPAPFAGYAIAVSAYRAGFEGCLNVEHSDPLFAAVAISQLAEAQIQFSTAVGNLDSSLLGALRTAQARGLVRVVLCDAEGGLLESNVRELHSAGIDVEQTSFSVAE